MAKMNDVMTVDDMQIVQAVQDRLVASYGSAGGHGFSPIDLAAALSGTPAVGGRTLTPKDVEAAVHRDLAQHRLLGLPQVLAHRHGAAQGRGPVTLVRHQRQELRAYLDGLAEEIRAGLTEEAAFAKGIARNFGDTVDHEAFEMLFLATLEHEGFRVQQRTLVTQAGFEGFAYRSSPGPEHPEGWYALEAKFTAAKIGMEEKKSGVSVFIQKLWAMQAKPVKPWHPLVGGVFLSFAGFAGIVEAGVQAAKSTQGPNVLLWEPRDLFRIWKKHDLVSLNPVFPGLLEWAVTNRAGSVQKLR
jgi:hypothetical protein